MTSFGGCPSRICCSWLFDLHSHQLLQTTTAETFKQKCLTWKSILLQSPRGRKSRGKMERIPRKGSKSRRYFSRESLCHQRLIYIALVECCSSMGMGLVTIGYQW